MFEKTLTDKLKRIFDLKKVTLDQPGESREQECLFVQIENARVHVKDGREVVKAGGKLTLFGNSEKLPFGYFFKKISQADGDDSKHFHFGPEENTTIYQNIVERSVSFVYLNDEQYDPALGIINEVTFQTQVE